MIIFDELMREKSDKLRLGMQILGTQDNAYWASWLITASLLNAFMNSEMIIIGKLYGFDVFTKTPFYVFFVSLFLTTQSYVMLAFMFSTLANNKT